MSTLIHHRTLFLGAALCCAMALQAHATVLLNDTFADGNRTTQSLPGSAQWYVGGASSTASVSASSGLTLTQNKAGIGTAVAYFTPTALQVGATLELTFSYSFHTAAVADNNFQFGLYNSGGSHLTQDGLGFNNSLFNNYTGYATSGVFGVDPSGPGRDHIESRGLAAGNNLLSMGTYTEGKTYIQQGAATPGEIYQASMQIARTASGITVTSQIGSTQMVQQYTGTGVTQFDAVGIFSNGNTSSFTFDSVRVEVVGNAPEPSVAAGIVLLGVAGISPALRRRIADFLEKRKSGFC